MDLQNTEEFSAVADSGESRHTKYCVFMFLYRHREVREKGGSESNGLWEMWQQLKLICNELEPTFFLALRCEWIEASYFFSTG